MNNTSILKGNIVDIRNRIVFYGQVSFVDKYITAIDKLEGQGDRYILPGFIDAHIHIESSMLVPSEFSRMAAPHGTVATVSDPHEIANVLGLKGVNFMIENGKKAAIKCHFGAPSCVPATTFETSGAELTAADVEDLLSRDDIWYLSEMMNYPGVLDGDSEVQAKIKAARKVNKVIDGHAPGLRGDEARKYFSNGITTDHECFTYEEGREKAELGVRILIREGSAAKNYEVLHSLIDEFPNQVMFCSDDKHPDDLMKGHINKLVARAIADGHNIFDVLHAACILPKEHYSLPVGTLGVGDFADFIIVKDLIDFEVERTYISGNLVASNGVSQEQGTAVFPINNFDTEPKKRTDFELAEYEVGEFMKVIGAIDHELVTRSLDVESTIRKGFVASQPERDILKISVINRYSNKKPAIAFVQGFGLKSGAIASCIAHDSHNIIGVGTNDQDLCEAVNMVIAQKGGIAAVSGEVSIGLSLPIAGIMSDQPGHIVAKQYEAINQFVKDELKSTLEAPFMTLSFMGLLVIPSLKMSDLGLFDADNFELVKY